MLGLLVSERTGCGGFGIALIIGDLHSVEIKIGRFSDNFKITHRNQN